MNWQGYSKRCLNQKVQATKTLASLFVCGNLLGTMHLGSAGKSHEQTRYLSEKEKNSNN